MTGAGDGAQALTRRFVVPVWAGRFTGQWWALAGDELVSAPSAPELAGQLSRMLTPASGCRRVSGQRPGQEPSTAAEQAG